MSPPLRQLLGWIGGSVAALALATLLLSARYQLERSHEELREEHALQQLAAHLNTELRQGTQAIVTASDSMPTPWHAWRWGSRAGREHDVAPLNRAGLDQLLNPQVVTSGPRHSAAWRVDLLATDQGHDALVLARPQSVTDGSWSGIWADVDELMRRAGVAELMRAGYRVRLSDTSQGVAWYQTESGNWDRAASTSLSFGPEWLQLRAAPRQNALRLLPLVTPSLVLLLGLILWLSLQLRQRQVLSCVQEELSESEQRRRRAVSQFGQALQSVAELESRLHLASLYDGGTGLANRSSLLHRLQALLAAARAGESQGVSVMAVGFDSLRHVNSSLGADFGARVFAAAAERIAATLPAGETLFHSADQQLALIRSQANGDGSPSPETAETLAERVAQAVEAPIPLDGHAIVLHPSIGIAEASSGYDSAEALLDQAGMAAAAVPPDSEHRYCRYSSATARASAERLQLEADLDRAFQEGQFVLEYEPFIQPLSQAAVGFEALIRWNHPTEGRLPPGRFVPLALQAGMAHRLNAWVMGEAARQAAAWRRAGLTDLFINFNLTAEAFVRPHLVEEMAALLGGLELPGQQLIVELTESTLVQDARAAARTLHELAELGVGAWLDDFGTGYSSLSHLRALPLKGVKIDRAFTERIDIDSRDFGFIKALIDLISYLGMQSIAEGVESAAQYELLGMTSCDLYQGYYFARSMPAAEAERWLRRREQGATIASTPAATTATVTAPSPAPIPAEQAIG